jgi:protein YIPF1/2
MHPLTGQMFQNIDQTNSKSFYDIELYQKYFNVDTKDVLDRICTSACLKPTFFSLIDEKGGDLYGPVWIPITVLFLMFVTESIHEVIAGTNGSFSRHYAGVLSHTFIVLYTMMIIWPLLGYLVCKYFGSPLDTESQHQESIPLINWICIYGYCTSILVLPTLLFVLFLPFLRSETVWSWILILTVFGLSTTFLVSNLWPELRRIHVQGNRTALLYLLITLHGFSLLYLKIHFL